jgi:hypothetical protein
MRRHCRILFLLVATLFVGSGWTGCNTNPLSGLLVTKGQKEREVAALRVEHDTKMAALRQEAETKTAQLLSSNLAQKQAAAAAFAGQDLVFKSIVTPTRTDLITHNLALEGWAALGVQPTYEAMKAMNDRVAAELDETRTSLEQLQKNHIAALAQNEALAEATEQFQRELSALEERRKSQEREFAAKLDEKQSEIIALQNEIVAAAEDKSASIARRDAQIAKLSWGAGIIAALCVAGAIFSPVFKQELGIAAVVFGGVAASLPFIEGWMIMAAVGAILAGIVVWVAIKYRKEEKVADALVLATQDVKESAPEVWENQIKPAVTDRLSKYRKTAGGKLTTARDPSIEKHIDSKLAAYDMLPGKPNP